MLNMCNRLPLFAVLLAVQFALAGCGAVDYFFLSAPEDTAQELYEAGEGAMRDKRYADAVDYFTKLKDRYPFSPYTPKAELGLADSFFLDEDYVLAVEAYKEFEALHPRHEAMPYVLYQIGVSNYRASDAIDKPQSSVRESLQYFLRVQESYPGSEYAAEAEKFVPKVRTLLAEHELFVADFYWNTDRYGAAYKRYTYVSDNFPDLPEVQDYAASRARLSYLRFQESRSQQRLEEEEGSWKDYFDWL